MTKSQRVLGDLAQAVVRHIGDDHAALGGSPNVDVVEPDARAGNVAAAVGGVDYLGRQRRPAGENRVDARRKSHERRLLCCRATR